MLDTTYIFDGTLGTSLNPPTGVAITATRDSTNVLDLLAARDLGAGKVTDLVVVVTQAFATLTSLQIQFQVGATAGGSFFTTLTSPVYPVAQLIAGAPIFRYTGPLNQLLNGTAGALAPPGQFLKLVYTVAGSNATTGAVFSYMTAGNDRNQTYIYPNNYTSAS